VLFAIVDIETTGSFSSKNGITEVGVVITDGNSIVDEYQTLVNPNDFIPPFIQNMTGITNEMVASAPTFSEIAPELHQLLEDKVFVAHNVNFDYKFIKYQFEQSGFQYNSRRLCTVRLSRKIVPGLQSYKLGNLSKAMGVNLNNAHRALADAKATAEIFNQLYQKNKGVIEKSLKANSKEATLPANLSKKVYDKLPNEPGVYFFINEKQEVIYIGKAKDLKKRVTSHFTGKYNKQKQAFYREVFDVQFELTGNELVAALLEDAEIKHRWPVYNRAQKHRILKYGVYSYYDQKNNPRLGINKVNNQLPFLVAFPSMSNARDWLFKKVEEYKLSPSMCGLPEFENDLVDIENHTDNFQSFLSNFQLDEVSQVLIGKGRHGGEKAIVYIENGMYKGFGFVGRNRLNKLSNYISVIDLKPDTIQVRGLLKSVLRDTSQNEFEVIELNH